MSWFWLVGGDNVEVGCSEVRIVGMHLGLGLVAMAFLVGMFMVMAVSFLFSLGVCELRYLSTTVRSTELQNLATWMQ